MKSPFTSKDQLSRAWDFIDLLARRAWDRDGVSQDQRTKVDNAARSFHEQMRQASSDLPDVAGDPPPPAVNVDRDSWARFAREELVGIVGRSDVRSVTDMILKSTSVLRKLKAPSTQRRFLFRGQQDVMWPVLPRRGRGPGGSVDNPCLDREIASLKEFRDKWPQHEVEEEDRNNNLSDDHVGWWFRMQHFDTGTGTRLLDVTTSPLAALYFACVDWNDGSVADGTDGVVYLWPEGDSGVSDDYNAMAALPTAQDIFLAQPNTDVNHFILNPTANERSKAQSSAYMWWSEYWKPPPSPSYYLRVPRDAKLQIVKDLLSFGLGPAALVRGPRGRDLEAQLRKSLG